MFEMGPLFKQGQFDGCYVSGCDGCPAVSRDRWGTILWHWRAVRRVSDPIGGTERWEIGQSDLRANIPRCCLKRRGISNIVSKGMYIAHASAVSELFHCCAWLEV